MYRERFRKSGSGVSEESESDVPIISAIGEYLLLSGGKRFRAKLLLLSSKLCGYEGDLHISMGSLIEFIHTATLLHDDVVDRAELRREWTPLIPNGEMRRVYWSETFSLQNVFLSWCRVETGKSSKPFPRQPPRWRKESWRN